ncbi:putative tryptophanyl-tRNA synthetase [Aureobasidium subglaciale]|nr:putative tryptophanyl-tRNA synthetase [Aureobasidium subglaciale]KAI5217424.1 putative tryptophanyl-tRNA synthetase [Aureobasidium subglaciale]KAI5221046.1 putative tryptophanyl-tRNA synthetase [Aureobasidium subglaciale]KAI5258576.1 putative tryptophanyl-tRNA synthetase [Aureobasidium subglaciale]
MSPKSIRAVCARSAKQSVVCRPLTRLSSSEASPSPRVIFSGIQPTGVPHLGNYLGAMQQWVKLQNEASANTSLIYSVVDLHAITVYQDPNALRTSKREMLAALLAVGLDPQKCTIFYQSDVGHSQVPAHSELMWILSCSASMGYLSRMTQWKVCIFLPNISLLNLLAISLTINLFFSYPWLYLTKLDLDENANPLDSSTKTKLKLGLFSYPVLQAADILIHRATHVPVGHDQSQHLEFARECAAGFNHLAGDKLLVQPETLLSPAKRVMALDKPTNKMSKSALNPKSRILITDSSSTISKKLRVALTDSIEGVTYDPSSRPGVSNLIEIAFNLDGSNHGAASPAEYAKDFEGLSLKALKNKVAEVVDDHLMPIRSKFEEIIGGDGKILQEAAQIGAEKARKSAESTMQLVRHAVGF